MARHNFRGLANDFIQRLTGINRKAGWLPPRILKFPGDFSDYDKSIEMADLFDFVKKGSPVVVRTPDGERWARAFLNDEERGPVTCIECRCRVPVGLYYYVIREYSGRLCEQCITIVATPDYGLMMDYIDPWRDLPQYRDSVMGRERYAGLRA